MSSALTFESATSLLFTAVVISESERNSAVLCVADAALDWAFLAAVCADATVVANTTASPQITTLNRLTIAPPPENRGKRTSPAWKEQDSCPPNAELGRADELRGSP